MPGLADPFETGGDFHGDETTDFPETAFSGVVGTPRALPAPGAPAAAPGVIPGTADPMTGPAGAVVTYGGIGAAGGEVETTVRPLRPSALRLKYASWRAFFAALLFCALIFASLSFLAALALDRLSAFVSPVRFRDLARRLCRLAIRLCFAALRRA